MPSKRASNGRTPAKPINGAKPSQESATLTVEEADLLRRTLRRLARTRGETALLFYDRLFEIAPETRRMFSGDMELQATKIISTLGTIVAELHNHAVLAPIATDLARRHVRYGVREEHYDLVHEALIWTLERSLGGEFTDDVRDVWHKAYGGLAAMMIEAAYRRPAATTPPKGN